MATEQRYPAAVITSGVCVDPAGPKEEGYFRKRVSERASVATHFFGFYDRSGQAIARNAIEDALAHWGWLHRP